MKMTKHELTQSRPICQWAGVVLSTYRKIKPWSKIEQTIENSSVSLGIAYFSVQFNVDNSLIDAIKNQTNKLINRSKELIQEAPEESKIATSQEEKLIPLKVIEGDQ